MGEINPYFLFGNNGLQAVLCRISEGTIESHHSVWNITSLPFTYNNESIAWFNEMKMTCSGFEPATLESEVGIANQYTTKADNQKGLEK